MEISGAPDPLVAAAIVAALLQLEEEQADADAVPATRPLQARWVRSGLPRQVESPFSARPAPTGDGWSLESDSRSEG